MVESSNPQKENFHQVNDLDYRCSQTVLEWIASIKKDLAERIEETKAIFQKDVALVDLHTHSNYSDGRTTVEANREAALHAGLDFMFATDHHCVEQKCVTDDFDDASWGQEPGVQYHHIGLLKNIQLFEPQKDSLAADYSRACEIAPFVWIPHPAGWYPARKYSESEIQALWSLPMEFAIEVINGAHKIYRAFDQFDETAVKVWDRLLNDGRHVTALGCSDAHVPEGLGCVWTGVTGATPEPDSIIKKLIKGRCFASEASLLDISLQGRPMGSTVKIDQSTDMLIKYRVADAAGLQSVRLVANGNVIEEIQADARSLIEGEWAVNPKLTPAYYRLESRATDDRRAFSTPIYVES